MRKIILSFIVILFLIPKPANSQNNGAAVAGAITTTAAAIGSIIMTINIVQEQVELNATEWILNAHPELTSFSLKTLDFDGKRITDLSSTSIISYRIREFVPKDKPELNGKKYVLFALTSYGWISDYGVNINKVKWILFDKNEWANIITAYVKLSSGVMDEVYIKDVINKGKITSKGIIVNNKLEIPFYKLEGDMYLVNDYSPKLKIVYNEKSLGFFLKETSDLVQLNKLSLFMISDYFFVEN